MATILESKVQQKHIGGEAEVHNAEFKGHEGTEVLSSFWRRNRSYPGIDVLGEGGAGTEVLSL